MLTYYGLPNFKGGGGKRLGQGGPGGKRGAFVLLLQLGQWVGLSCTIM